jgi:hypothetical protein
MIAARDVQKTVQNRTKVQQVVFDTFLKRIAERIKYTSQTRPDVTWVTYQVPEFVLGRPMYNVRTAVNYVMSECQKKGFDVEELGNNVLFISWAPRASVDDPRRSLPAYRPTGMYRPYGASVYNDSLLDNLVLKRNS